jgi:phosphate transport system substrate-binding protein
MKRILTLAAVSALALAAAVPTLATAQGARDYVWASGSSTVFPFASRVAENYARKNAGKKAPKVESIGTGGGIKAFCGGLGAGFPDIADASRPMKKSEFDACVSKGVKDIIQIKIGFDGIVVATDKDGADYNLSPQALYLALSNSPYVAGKFASPNPLKTWDQVGNGLPGNRIQVYGPPPSSGTRDAFVELAIEAGARKFPTVDAIRSDNEATFKGKVDVLRKDGGWIDAGENDNVIVQTLTRTPGALGVFGYSYLEENMDKIKGASINGVKPTAGSIADGSYPLSRSLFIYVKKSMLTVTPGLKEFVAEFTSDAATGRGGYLASKGLVLLPPGQHDGQKAAAVNMTVMTRPAS